MVVVRKAVALVNGDVELVGALDEIEAVDRERHVRLAAQPLRIHLLDVRVGAVAAHAVGVEQADAEHEVVGRRGAREPSGERAAASPVWKTNDGCAVAIEERDLGDLDLARSPAPLGWP